MLLHPRNHVASLIVALLLMSPAVVLAQCPTTTMTCSICAPSCGPASSSDTQAPSGSLACPSSGSTMDFNLTSGTFNATGRGGTNFWGVATVSAKDAYTVMGVPTGIPLTINAKLHVSGGTGSGCGPGGVGGGVFASLTVGGSSQSMTASSPVSCDAFGCCATSTPVNTDVVLSITCLAGQPFEMTTVDEARGRGTVATLSAALSFDNLPAGASIVSCQGFNQNGPTAVSIASWGRVKQIYR